MNRFRNALRSLFVQGPSAKRQIDRLLCADAADPREDLKTTLDQVGLDRLLLLRQTLQDGRVVERCYRRKRHNGQTEGCLLYWLMGITSRQDLFARRFSSEEFFKAVVRTIRFWDYGDLTQEVVLEVLQAAIEVRQTPAILQAEFTSIPQDPAEPVSWADEARDYISAL